ADGTATNSVQVKVTDANGNPVNGMNVDFTADNGAVIAASAQSDVNGQITLPVSSTMAGNSTVTATANGSSQSVTMNFVADSNTAQVADGSLSVVANNAVANGVSANKVQITVTDANGNALSGQTVTLSASNSAAIAATAVTAADGTVQVPVTSLKAGDSTVTASVNGSSQTVTVTFVADDNTSQIASGALTVTADNAVANGSAGNEVQVIVTDANGNVLAGQDVTFSASNGATIAASGTTGSDGSLKMPVTSTVAGVSTVKATVNGSNQSVDVTFVADSGTAQIAAGNLTALTDNAIANGTASNDVQVKVTDANGNAVAGQSVSFSADNGAAIAASGTTDVNGLVQMAVTSLKAGVSSVTATVNGNSQQVNVTFVADSSSAAIAAADIVLLNDGAKASGSDPDLVQVTVKDANGNVVSGQAVSFSADNSATVKASETTDANGIAVVAVTSTLAGSSTVTASTNASSQTVVATFVADSATAQIQASDMLVTENGALSNGVAQNKVMVKVTDANNNVVGGVDVAFSATNGANVPATATTDASGVVTIPVTTTQSGNSQITATINGSSQSVEVMFIAATIPVITNVADNAGTVTGSILSGQVTNDTLPELSGTADPNATVRLYDDGRLVKISTADADGLWSLTPESAISGDGDHTLTMTGAVSRSSEESPKSEAFILNLDTVAELPTIDSVIDTNGAVPQNGTTNGDGLLLRGTSEPGATVTIYGVRMADRIQASLGSSVVDETGHWHCLVADVRIFQGTGEYQFTAKTTDIAGNSSKTSDMDPWVVNYQSWPAPNGTPEYTLTASDESVDQTQVAELLSSTGNALFISQISGGYSGSIDMPAASTANSGNRVYISIEGSNDVGLRANGKTLKILSQGSQTTWYSNGSSWTQIY
ncbi:MAG: Ig-like domain-containing protein, partial [Aeromonadaceae bacterium]